MMKTIVPSLLHTALVGSDDSCANVNDKAILVVSFGTSYTESRRKTIEEIETVIRESYPAYKVHSAFTSQMIINILKKRDGIHIDNVMQALEKLIHKGVKRLIVQPTHLMNGFEYDKMVTELDIYKNQFDNLLIGAPLLADDDDLAKVIDVITSKTAPKVDSNTAVIFMGHGTEHFANKVYRRLQEKIIDAGYDNYYIGTVEAKPTLEDIMVSFRARRFSKVLLQPLMVVAGDHANNDMAGDDEDSWKTILEAQGYEVECILKGLGELNEIQELYVDHIRAVMGEL